jgi:hypothetical protein
MNEKGVTYSFVVVQLWSHPRNLRAKIRMARDNLELVTIVEYVLAAGAYMRPGFIFAGNTEYEVWYDPNNGKALYDLGDYFCSLLIMFHRISPSQNGWTSDWLSIQWCLKVFLPKAREHRNSDYPDSHILLMIDGHGSHISYELIKLAAKHGS